jgi:hypothetical protein
MTEFDATKALDVVFDFLGMMTSLAGDLTGGFFLDESFEANDAFVGDGASHIVDSATAGNGLTGVTLILAHLTRDGASLDVEQE